MQEELFYESYVQRGRGTFAEDRLQRILHSMPAQFHSLLDAGSGNGRNLEFLRQFFPNARMCGAEIAAQGVENIRKLGFEAVQCDVSVEIPYADDSFDVVICGEVIEHVIYTDRLLQEIGRVLRPSGTLILTTPNLAYAVNRVLLLFGIQPLFTETSYHRNLGRVFRFLGQGNQTQGHLKIFTARSLRELVESCGFKVEALEGYLVMQTGIARVIDSVFRRIPSLAGGLIVRARAQK
jgi:SAM-dependent methyltransferase